MFRRVAGRSAAGPNAAVRSGTMAPAASSFSRVSPPVVGFFGAVWVRRIDAPFSSMRCALCSKRSQMVPPVYRRGHRK